MLTNYYYSIIIIIEVYILDIIGYQQILFKLVI